MVKQIALTCLATAMLAVLMVTPALSAETQVTLTVDGLECATSELNVSGILGETKGVSGIVIDTDERTAEFTFDGDSTDMEALKKSLADIGHSVLKVEGL